MKKSIAALFSALLLAGLLALPASAAADPHAPVVTYMPVARYSIRADWEFSLVVNAKSPDEGGRITYQWYQAAQRDKNGNPVYSAMPGETDRKYIKYARLDKLSTPETSVWYKCVITNTYSEGGKAKTASVVTPDIEVHAFLGFVDSFQYWVAKPALRSLPGSVLTEAKGFWGMFRLMAGG